MTFDNQCIAGEALDQIDRLRASNTRLLEALMDMVNQSFYHEIGGMLSHSHMVAEEGAIAVLIEAGMAEEVEAGKNVYCLLWDKLEERKNPNLTDELFPSR